MKILLLEDDHLLNKAIHAYLTTLGHEVNSYKDGQDALDDLMSSIYDLLILDINVPSINGLELLEKIHESKIQTPAIFISALLDIEDISRAYDLGCNDYLKKPFHLKELTFRIDKILESDYIPFSHTRLSSNYSLDLDTNTLKFKGEVQIVSHKQMQILTLLAKNRNRIVGYTLFQDYVWDGYDIKIPTIRAEINRLKKILKEEMIINIRNMGYMIKKPI